jgi:hypothetical protein
VHVLRAMAAEPIAKPSRRVSFGNGNQLRVDVAEAVRAYDRYVNFLEADTILVRLSSVQLVVT